MKEEDIIQKVSVEAVGWKRMVAMILLKYRAGLIVTWKPSKIAKGDRTKTQESWIHLLIVDFFSMSANVFCNIGNLSFSYIKSFRVA